MNQRYSYRDLGELTQAVRFWLGLGVVLAVVAIVSSVMVTNFLSSDVLTPAEAESHDSRQLVVTGLQLIVHLITVVFFARWIVRAHRNAWAFGGEKLRMTPGWAVGYFFLPLLNLWRPYQGMKDLWQASHNQASWSSLAAGAILPLWWLLWLLAGALQSLAGRALLRAEGVVDLMRATFLQISADGTAVLLGLAAMSLVKEIAAAQQSRRARVLEERARARQARLAEAGGGSAG
ncbi:MAG: DUF4328 domain-containing protein [Acidobacteriota bacterium]